MIAEISIFILGAMVTAIPLIIWYLRGLASKHIESVMVIKNELSKTLTEMNQLHNNAAGRYQSFENRLIKLETETAARNYGKKL